MTTLTDRVENQLREHIITGAISPSSRLRVEELRERYEAGATPIREALSRLLSEGLVELENNKGFRVVGLSQADLEDICLVRVMVETTALRRSMAFGGDDWEANVIAALHRFRLATKRMLDGPEAMRIWESAHDGLHRALISACRSSRLLDLQESYQQQHTRYRRLLMERPLDIDIPLQEHGELVDIVLSRDADLATSVIEQHMQITVDALNARRFWT